jgi:hypothetical protein
MILARGIPVDPKPHPNRALYVRMLRSMSPEQRLSKAFELGEMSKRLLWDGLRDRHPDMSDEDLRKLYLERLASCHNRNY